MVRALLCLTCVRFSTALGPSLELILSGVDFLVMPLDFVQVHLNVVRVQLFRFERSNLRRRLFQTRPAHEELRLFVALACTSR